MYKFANDRNIVIEEVSKFENEYAIGQYLGRFDFTLGDDPDYLQNIHVRIKSGLNPVLRLSTIAHEIGHDKHAFEMSSSLKSEMLAWDEGEKLLQQLKIRIPQGFYRAWQNHKESILFLQKMHRLVRIIEKEKNDLVS